MSGAMHWHQVASEQATRIAELEAERAATLELVKLRTTDLGLVAAERDKLITKQDKMQFALNELYQANIELEAERDKLRTARDTADSQLIAALEAHAWGECLGYVHSARLALSTIGRET